MSRNARRRQARLKVLGYVGLGVLALTTAGVVGFVVMTPAEQAPVPTQVASYFSNPPTQTPRPVIPTAVFIGDSYTLGAGSSGASKGWANVAARTLDWFPYISADGSSGYVTEGKKGFTTGELIDNAMPEVSPRYVVIASGYNDSANDQEKLAAAIDADLTAAATKWKEAKLIVIGPWAPNATVNANQETTRGLLEAAAAAHGAVFIDPISQGWFNTPGMIGADKIHPTDAGHTAIGTKAADALKAALKL